VSKKKKIWYQSPFVSFVQKSLCALWLILPQSTQRKEYKEH
jgi:hypothetical protein